MPKFSAIHPSQKKIMEGNLKLAPEQNKLLIEFRSHCSADAYWIRSWYVPELEKIFCEWNAKDAESIRDITDKAEWLETEGIYEMNIVEAENFREKPQEIIV